MKYFVMIDGERKGPFTIGQLRSMWNAGNLTGETLYWREGLADWEALSAIQGEIEGGTSPVSPPPPPPSPPSQPTHSRPAGEQTLFADQQVVVTSERVSIHGTTYALRNITSVRMDVSNPGSGCIAVLIIIGAFGVLASLASLVTGKNSDMGLFKLLIFGIVPIAIGTFLFLTRKPVFHLKIVSAAGEVKALSAPDEAYIERVVKSINSAMAKCR